jgi:hypothetical protein
LADRTLRPHRPSDRDKTLPPDAGLEMIATEGTDYETICHRSDRSNGARDC